MNILFNFNKWNEYVNTHMSSVTTGFIIVAIISLLIFYILFFKISNKESEFKTEIGDAVASFFASAFCTLISTFFLFVLFRLLGFILIGILLFIACFALGKFVVYLCNKPKKQKIELTNLSDIAKGVYDAMLEINPNVKYEDIYASIEKKFGK